MKTVKMADKSAKYRLEIQQVRERFSYHSDQSLPCQYGVLWCRALSSVICVNSEYSGHSSVTLTTLPLPHGAKKENHTSIQSTGHTSLPKLSHVVRAPLP